LTPSAVLAGGPIVRLALLLKTVITFTIYPRSTLSDCGLVAQTILLHMENDNEEKFEELTTTDVRDLQLSMRYFFINYSQEEIKRVMWEFYRAWVFNTAEIVEREEITDMLLFYEIILDFMKTVNDYCDYLDRTVLKRD